MKVYSPLPFAVYQRNQGGYASVEIEIELGTNEDLSTPVAELIQGETSNTITLRKEGSRFRACLESLPAGLYRCNILTGAFSDEIRFAVGDIWLLAGQSNMKGFGKLDGCEEPCDAVFCFLMNQRWQIAEEPLVWLNDSPDPVYHTIEREEVDYDPERERFSRTQGSGLGIAFGKEVYSRTGVPIGLLPCAKGSTSMEKWSPTSDRNADNLYAAMLRRIEAIGGQVAGCLWFQGESDAIECMSESYENRTEKFVQELRKSLACPELPFIFAQISVTYDKTVEESHWNRVQDQQLALEKRIFRSAMVPTYDAVLSDMVHSDSASLIRTGKRMAWRALELCYGIHEHCRGPRLASIQWNNERNELRLSFEHLNGKLTGIPRGFSVLNGKDELMYSGRFEQSEVVVLRFKSPVAHGATLWHGKGCNPLISIKDEAGIPLPAFGPVNI